MSFCSFSSPREAAVKSIVTAKETKHTQGYWPQQYIWHSERHCQEAYVLQKPHSKNPLFLVPDFSIQTTLLLQRLISMVASVVKNPTVVMVTLLCGRVLGERALQLLLRDPKAPNR